MSVYLQWLSWFVLLPIGVLWLVFWRSLIRYKTTFIYGFVFALPLGLVWDLLDTKTHVWTFPESCCSSVRPGGLPLEEILFIFFVIFYIQTITLVLLDSKIRFLSKEHE